MKKSTVKENGFSLIELVLVIALLGTILTLTTVNLIRPFSKAKIQTVSSDISSILRQAQNKAINTDTSGEAETSEYGVHFETNKYILFRGVSYNPSDPNNFAVDVPDNITITPNLPSGDVIFQRISGEVANYNESNNSICVSETSTNKNVSLTVNFVGVVNVQEGC